jgi:hypothetical protein
MLFFVFVAIILLVFGSAVRYSSPSWRMLRPPQALWHKVAHDNGLTQIVEDTSVTGSPVVSAYAGGLNVRFEKSGALSPSTRITVWDADRRIEGFTIHPRLDTRVTPLSFETGDPEFDAAFRVDGDATAARAFLSADVRQELLQLRHEGSLEIDGALRLTVPRLQRRTLSRHFPLLFSLARRLVSSHLVAERVAANARRDPDAQVRLHNVRMLARELRQETVAAEALRAACSDESPQIRLEAARALGAEAHDVLLRLAERGTSVAVEAVEALDGSAPLERARALLTRVVAGSNVAVASACAALLGRIGGDASVAPLADVLRNAAGALAVAAAKALGATRAPSAEAPLLDALTRDDTELRAAAVAQLGAVGGAVSVPALKEAAERDASLDRAVRRAIAEIHARMPDASPGELSMADVDAGRLSIADSGAGHVSLADEQAGRVSLPERVRQR